MVEKLEKITGEFEVPYSKKNEEKNSLYELSKKYEIKTTDYDCDACVTGCDACNVCDY